MSVSAFTHHGAAHYAVRLQLLRFSEAFRLLGTLIGHHISHLSHPPDLKKEEAACRPSLPTSVVQPGSQCGGDAVMTHLSNKGLTYGSLCSRIHADACRPLAPPPPWASL